MQNIKHLENIRGIVNKTKKNYQQKKVSTMFYRLALSEALTIFQALL